MTAEPVSLITAEEFWKLPDPEHGGKMELVRGIVACHMPVGGPHGEIALTCGSALQEFARRDGLGAAGVEVGFVLARRPDVVRAPDVHFVRADRLPEGRMPSGFFEGPPRPRRGGYLTR
jgi:Uma2 family endonuclease